MIVGTRHSGKEVEHMATYKLKVMPALEQRGIIELDKSGPSVAGNGSDNYVCNKCGNIIAKSVKLSDLVRFQNAAFKCFECKQVGIL